MSTSPTSAGADFLQAHPGPPLLRVVNSKGLVSSLLLLAALPGDAAPPDQQQQQHPPLLNRLRFVCTDEGYYRLLRHHHQQQHRRGRSAGVSAAAPLLLQSDGGCCSSCAQLGRDFARDVLSQMVRGLGSLAFRGAGGGRGGCDGGVFFGITAGVDDMRCWESSCGPAAQPGSLRHAHTNAKHTLFFVCSACCLTLAPVSPPSRWICSEIAGDCQSRRKQGAPRPCRDGASSWYARPPLATPPTSHEPSCHDLSLFIRIAAFRFYCGKPRSAAGLPALRCGPLGDNCDACQALDADFLERTLINRGGRQSGLCPI